MYRDDQNALVARLDALAKTEQQNEVMKKELLALRRAASQSVAGNPYLRTTQLGPGERAALGGHELEHFPVWAVAVLHLCTFGLFSLVHFGMQHGRLPRASENDPTAGQAVGLSFVPFFNYYWVFFNPLRLCDRLSLQFRIRGSDVEAPRGLVLASAISLCIPYINMLMLLTLWMATACVLQSRVNELVALGAVADNSEQPLLASG